MKKRMIYAALFVMCLILCALIVILFNSRPFIRGFIGDILVIGLIYFLIQIFRPFPPVRLATFVLVLAFATEFLQYLKLISSLGLEQYTAARIILGSVFDPMDLLAYSLGTVGVYIMDAFILRKYKV